LPHECPKTIYKGEIIRMDPLFSGFPERKRWCWRDADEPQENWWGPFDSFAKARAHQLKIKKIEEKELG